MRLPRHTYRLVVVGCGPLADDWSVPSYKTHSPPRQYISYSESCSISVWRTYLCSFSISLIDGKIDLACHPSVTHSHYVILGEELRTFNPIPIPQLLYVHTSWSVSCPRMYRVIRICQCFQLILLRTKGTSAQILLPPYAPAQIPLSPFHVSFDMVAIS